MTEIYDDGRGEISDDWKAVDGLIARDLAQAYGDTGKTVPATQRPNAGRETERDDLAASDAWFNREIRRQCDQVQLHLGPLYNDDHHSWSVAKLAEKAAADIAYGTKRETTVDSGTMGAMARILLYASEEHTRADAAEAKLRVADEHQTPGRFPYRQHPHELCGSNTARQEVGDPGHCEDCCSVGHVVAHPELGCGDVGCYRAHGEPGSDQTPRVPDDADQPDGITDDSYDLPDQARAAERVNEFLSWFGDGRIYLDDPHPPLFARDLQALTNAALAAPGEGEADRG